MKKIFKTRKIIIALFILISIISIISNCVNAVDSSIVDTTKKATLTITKYEHANGSEKDVALAGVKFTVYSIPSNIEAVVEAEKYIKSNQVTSYTKTTPSNGIITFTNLELGRYLVVEASAPKNVLTKMESFLIDLPRTSDNGKSWNYDVTVYPKNITIYGKVTLNQSTPDGGKMKGAEWELEKKGTNGSWEKYPLQNGLITDNNGKIVIENLEAGEYKLVPKSTIEGYILDKSAPIEFEVNAKNTNLNFNVTSENQNIKKYVKLSDGTYGSEIGAFATDRISWKTSSDLASIIAKLDKYEIIEELQDKLILDKQSIQVYGVNESGNETKLGSESYTIEEDAKNRIKFKFNTKKLGNYRKINITYDTTFDETIKNGEFEVKTKLEYTNFINADGVGTNAYTTNTESAKVHIGSVLIYKSGVEGNALAGAQFKIAKSKENANNGEFIKDFENQDIIATSNESGYVIFDGLKYGQDNEKAKEASSTSYWIVEVQAPSYEDNGETKYYNLLDKPVKVQVNYTSNEYSQDNTTVVINKKGFTLPLTGGYNSLISIILGITIIISSLILIKKRIKN